jgi:hypothetical protein
MNKLYLYAGLIAAAGLVYWRYDYVMSENERLADDLHNEQEAHKQTAKVLSKERQNATEAALLAQQFYQDVEKDNAELEKLRACVANNTCGVRIAKGACPKLPSTGTDAGGTEAADAADRKQLEQDYFRLFESIKLTKSRYEWMQRELISRSDPGYCKP